MTGDLGSSLHLCSALGCSLLFQSCKDALASHHHQTFITLFTHTNEHSASAFYPDSPTKLTPLPDMNADCGTPIF